MRFVFKYFERRSTFYYPNAHFNCFENWHIKIVHSFVGIRSKGEDEPQFIQVIIIIIFNVTH